MSEPFWVPLTGSVVDYKGAYAPATQYAQGDVVRYNGVDYLCVNPALGQAPPIALPASLALVTALPGSPIDGQEIILVDSLTAPTFQWRLRYVAALASNKWVFLGGSDLLSEIAAQELAPSTVYGDPPTPGPSVTVPVAGDYMLTFGAYTVSIGNVGLRWVAPKFGAATALDADGCSTTDSGSTAVPGTNARQIRRTIAAGTLVKLQYRHTTAQTQVASRFLSVRPFAVGG